MIPREAKVILYENMEDGTFVSWLALESFFISEMSTNILMRVL